MSAAPIADPAVPALETLLGEEGIELARSILSVDGTAHDIKVAQVRYVPGRSVVVQYRARLARPDGQTSPETLVATSGLDVPGEAAVISDGDVSIAFWRVPHDPFLPGLAAASDPDRVTRLLTRLGAPPGRAQLRTRAYRPGRRAVIEAITPTARIFLKIVRPEKVAELQQRHVALAAALPVPHSHGWAEELGLVAMQAMPGRTLRKAVESGARRLPDATHHIALLDSLPELGSAAASRTPVWARARSHARLLGAVLPPEAGRVSEIADRISSSVVDEQPRVPVHGDFHSSQVLVRQGEILGLIDVDTAGDGARVEDLGGMLGHLATVALASPARRNAERYGAALIREFDRTTDPALLRRTVAATVFGLATGPFRVQESRWGAATRRRLQLTERWLESADAL
jgi:hypothetical protein